jgi:hypothetical protein
MVNVLRDLINKQEKNQYPNGKMGKRLDRLFMGRGTKRQTLMKLKL